MGAKTAISLEEYLHTSFENPDREYRGGEIVERFMPDVLHGRAQLRLGMYFENLREKVGVFPCLETRMRVQLDVFLIPDVAVFSKTLTEVERVPDTPPFVVIEILSPDDRMSAVTEKLQEYRAWGVRHVWLVDPHGRRLYTCDARLTEVEVLQIPELGIELTPGQIFD